MHYKFLCRFLLDIGKPLGGSEEENLWDVAKIASSFKLKCDHYGYREYNQFIYELFILKFHAEAFKEGTPDTIKQIKQYNKETQLRLMYYRKNRHIERSNRSSALQLKANFNILHDDLTLLILLRLGNHIKLAMKQNHFSDEAISLDSELQQNNNRNPNHLIEPDGFEGSCDEVTDNCQRNVKQHHITNESHYNSNLELPINKSQKPFSLKGENIKLISSSGDKKQKNI